ncbi:MAG: DUF308 domain-containing protein [Christensenella sp.]|nr:DUF308 domain-containing protein [Christensenella sp.]
MGKAKPVLFFIFCAMAVAIGVCLFFFPISVVDVFAQILGILVCVFGTERIAFFLYGTKEEIKTRISTFLFGIILVVCGIFLLTLPGLMNEVIRIGLGGWLFFIGGTRLLSAYTYYRNHVRDWGLTLLIGFLLIAGSISLFAVKNMWVLVLSTFFAAYFVLIGIAGLVRFFATEKKRKKKSPNIPLPFWIEAYLPQATLKWIKTSLTQEAEPERIYSSNALPPDPDPADIEVLIHLSEIGSSIFGHVDLVIENQVFSYGNYDHAKENIKYFGIFCDGVLAVCERDEYIRFSLDTARKTVISYRLALKETEKQIVKRNVAEFIAKCEPWEIKNPKQNGYANALKKRGAKLLKIKNGKYRTYFMLNTNCALLMNHFFYGTEAPKARTLGGIVLPGSFISAYEMELNRPGGVVADRDVFISTRVASQQKEKKEERRQAKIEKSEQRQRRNAAKKK